MIFAFCPVGCRFGHERKQNQQAEVLRKFHHCPNKHEMVKREICESASSFIAVEERHAGIGGVAKLMKCNGAAWLPLYWLGEDWVCIRTTRRASCLISIINVCMYLSIYMYGVSDGYFSPETLACPAYQYLEQEKPIPCTHRFRTTCRGTGTTKPGRSTPFLRRT